jgi:chromosome segregation ATPase
MTPEQQNFIEHVNHTPKEFSHNKLQQTIEILENDLKKSHDINSEKDMQINLLKTTIQSLQSETKSFSSQIQSLQKVISENETTLLTNQQLLNTEKTKVSELSSLNTQLQSDLSELKSQLLQSQEDNFALQRNATNIAFELSELKKTIDNQVTAIDSHHTASKEYQSKFDNLQTIHEQTSIELDTLKLELAQFKTQNQSLQENLDNKTLELHETENQLKKHLIHQVPLSNNPQRESLTGRSRRIMTKRR